MGFRAEDQVQLTTQLKAASQEYEVEGKDLGTIVSPTLWYS